MPLRTRLKHARAAMDAAQARRGALLIRGRLFTWLASTRARLQEARRPAPRHIAAFWSMPDEPELQPLLYQWAQDPSLTVALPVVSSPDAALSFRRWLPGEPMRTGTFSIPEPTGAEAPLPDVVLVPTLGFTRAGDRVGYGKGYYDRTLAAWKAQGHVCTTIGIAWACGDLSATAYTPAPHDVRLDAILTDRGWALPAPELR